MFQALLSSVASRKFIIIKPVLTIVVSMDLHAMQGGYYSRGATIAHNAVIRRGYYSRGATIAYNAVIQRGYYSRGATIAYSAVLRGGYYSREVTKQRGRLFEEIRYISYKPPPNKVSVLYDRGGHSQVCP